MPSSCTQPAPDSSARPAAIATEASQASRLQVISSHLTPQAPVDNAGEGGGRPRPPPKRSWLTAHLPACCCESSEQEVQRPCCKLAGTSKMLLLIPAWRRAA